MSVRDNIVTFIKNASIVCTGTMFGQIISFIATLVLTRLYSPQQFGEYYIILTFAGFLGGVSCLSLENAAMLVPKLKDIKYILLSCIPIALIFASCCTSLLLLISHYYIEAGVYENFDTLVHYSLFIWIYIFIYGLHNSLNAIAARRNKNSAIAFSKGAGSLTHNSFVILFGWLGFGVFGLCASSLLGLIAIILILQKSANQLSFKSIARVNFNKIIHVVKNNIRLPKYHFFTSILLHFNNIGLILLLSIWYDAAYVGLIAFALRVLKTPFIITLPLSNVFISMITNHSSLDKLRRIYMVIVLKLLILSCIGIAILNYLPAALIVWIFGEAWVDILTPIKILSLFVCAQIIQNIVSGIYMLCQKQKLQLFLVLLQTVVMVAIIWSFSVMPETDINNMLHTLSICSSLCIAIQLVCPMFFISSNLDTNTDR